MESGKKFADFARGQIYALQRWIAGLSTFLIGATFTIIALRNACDETLYNNWFRVVIIITVVHILSILVYQMWTLYMYYNKKESKKQKDIDRCERIEKRIWIWGTFNTVLFFFGFVSFLVFMYKYLI